MFNQMETNKSREEGEAQESIQSSTTPNPGHHMGGDKNTRKHHIQESHDFVWFFMYQSTIFQLCREGSSWVEPVLSKG